MRSCALLFLLCTWACPLLVQARQFLFLAAPNVLQMDTEETIVIQGHEFQKAVDLIITVQDFPHKKRPLFSGETRLTEPNYLNMFTIKIPSANIKSEFEGEKQYVVVKAESMTDQSLSVEKAILISRSTGYIYIQTDKSIYTPSQTVLYRIFTTDHNMDPQSKSVLVELQNPSGVTVIQNTWQVEDGLIANSIPIPELASCGEWKIVASYQNDPDKKFTSEFEVKEYVLPSFEVQLTSKDSYFYVGDSEFTIDITARYLHLEEVQGYAFVTFSVIYQKKKYNLQNPLQRVEIDEGKGSATVTMKQLIDSFENNTNLVGASISVNVNVFSSGGDMVQAERSGIHIVESPYRIRSTQTPRYFKPGVPFQFSVVVTNPDESPVPGLLVTCESTKTPSRTNEDGVASITLNLGSESGNLQIKVKTSDSRLKDSQQASFTLSVTAYNTWRNSQNLLHIEVTKEPQKLSLNMLTMHGPQSDVKNQITDFTVLRETPCQEDDWLSKDCGYNWDDETGKGPGAFNCASQIAETPPLDDVAGPAEPKEGQPRKWTDGVSPEEEGDGDRRRRELTRSQEESLDGEDETSPGDTSKPGGQRPHEPPRHAPGGGVWLSEVRGKVAGWVGRRLHPPE